MQLISVIYTQRICPFSPFHHTWKSLSFSPCTPKRMRLYKLWTFASILLFLYWCVHQNLQKKDFMHAQAGYESTLVIKLIFLRSMLSLCIYLVWNCSFFNSKGVWRNMEISTGKTLFADILKILWIFPLVILSPKKNRESDTHTANSNRVTVKLEHLYCISICTNVVLANRFSTEWV